MVHGGAHDMGAGGAKPFRTGHYMVGGLQQHKRTRRIALRPDRGDHGNRSGVAPERLQDHLGRRHADGAQLINHLLAMAVVADDQRRAVAVGPHPCGGVLHHGAGRTERMGLLGPLVGGGRP